ncbi:hypothetical protein T03_14945 [Trichinella britovi]|uniref:Uncharacterized protein n=1 Tax=Trichinella britovi TaxID=45882 RepID=A0A0V1D099_TRIBR|nr:hypothetical protein T03_14945 [Trichinella britovi]
MGKFSYVLRQAVGKFIAHLFYNYWVVSNGTLHDITGNHCECLEISKVFQILKKGFSPIFAKTTKSITHEICNCREEHWNPKIDIMGRNRSEVIRVIQQTHPPHYRLRSSRDIRLKERGNTIQITFMITAIGTIASILIEGNVHFRVKLDKRSLGIYNLDKLFGLCFAVRPLRAGVAKVVDIDPLGSMGLSKGLIKA